MPDSARRTVIRALTRPNEKHCHKYSHVNVHVRPGVSKLTGAVFFFCPFIGEKAEAHRPQGPRSHVYAFVPPRTRNLRDVTACGGPDAAIG